MTLFVRVECQKRDKTLFIYELSSNFRYVAFPDSLRKIYA